MEDIRGLLEQVEESRPKGLRSRRGPTTSRRCQQGARRRLLGGIPMHAADGGDLEMAAVVGTRSLDLSVELPTRTAMQSNCSKAAFRLYGCQSGGKTRITGKLRVRVAEVVSVGAVPTTDGSLRGRTELEKGEISCQAARAKVRASHKTGHGQRHVSKNQRNDWFSQGGSGSGWCLNHWARLLALPFLVLKGPRP